MATCMNERDDIQKPTVAIIGAGMAGLTAANLLKDRFDVTVFDKSRGVGGRMSTRYADAYEFDHGAQYFTIGNPEFEALISSLGEGVQPWESNGLYLKLDGSELDTGRPRFVGAPRMNTVAKTMAKGLCIKIGRRVTDIGGGEGRYTLSFEEGPSAGRFEHLICTAPAPQSAALLSAGSPLQEILDQVRMRACFALMVGLEVSVDLDWDSLRVEEGPVSWIALNSSKPGRDPDHTTLVIHASPDWSDDHKEHDRDNVQAALLSRASELCGIELENAGHIALHRWLYAYADEGVGDDYLVDPESGIILAGDWCLGGRVEGAFLSGRAAARALLR